MRISEIRLRNFKRFTDLVITKIPATARLVVVVGPNGCGKSSLFDALLDRYRSQGGFGGISDPLYFRKHADGEGQSVEVLLHGGEQLKKGSLYVRTAYRNDPDFDIGNIGRPVAATENLRFHRVIENDQTVSDNYQRLVYETMAAVYNESNNDMTVAALRHELIGEIRASMQNVFGNLLINNISDPLGAGAFYFKKGDVSNYHYKNLSGGEKSAFDLILDMHVKRRSFTDTIYCIDELETHLHTRVQGLLLHELYRIVPVRSQLWVTTHSLGVIRAAQEIEKASPGSVCIIDFEGVDADASREVIPSSLGRVCWEKLLSITLDDLSTAVAPRVLVVCEGSRIGNRRKNFDSEIYNRVFGQIAGEVLFVSGGSSNEVATFRDAVSGILSQILRGTRVVAMCDRDDRSEREVQEFEQAGNLVLTERNLESYLLDDEVLQRLVESLSKTDKIQEVLEAKRLAIESSVARGNPIDDLKSASGDLFVAIRRILGLHRAGNTADAFMKDTLAPLITPETAVFGRLKREILDRL